MQELKQLISQNESYSFQQINKFEKELKQLITDYLPSKKLYQKLKEIVPLDVLYNKKKSLMHIAEKISRSLLTDYIEEEIFFSKDLKETDAEDFEIVIYGALGEESDQYEKSMKKLTDQYGYDRVDEFLEIAQKKMEIQIKENQHQAKAQNINQAKIQSMSEESIFIPKEHQDKEGKVVEDNDIIYEKIPSVDVSINQSLMSQKSKVKQTVKIPDFKEALDDFVANYIALFLSEKKQNNIIPFFNRVEKSKQELFEEQKKVIQKQLKHRWVYNNGSKQDNTILDLSQYNKEFLNNILQEFEKITEFLQKSLKQSKLDRELVFSDKFRKMINMDDISSIIDIRVNYISQQNVSFNQQPHKNCLLIEHQQANLFGERFFKSSIFSGYDYFDKNSIGKKQIQNSQSLFNRKNENTTCFFGREDLSKAQQEQSQVKKIEQNQPFKNTNEYKGNIITFDENINEKDEQNSKLSIVQDKNNFVFNNNFQKKEKEEICFQQNNNIFDNQKKYPLVPIQKKDPNIDVIQQKNDIQSFLKNDNSEDESFQKMSTTSLFSQNAFFEFTKPISSPSDANFVKQQPPIIFQNQSRNNSLFLNQSQSQLNSGFFGSNR